MELRTLLYAVIAVLCVVMVVGQGEGSPNNTSITPGPDGPVSDDVNATAISESPSNTSITPGPDVPVSEGSPTLNNTATPGPSDPDGNDTSTPGSSSDTPIAPDPTVPVSGNDTTTVISGGSDNGTMTTDMSDTNNNATTPTTDTDASVSPSTSAKPENDTKADKCSGRHFDVGSFFGGIVLAAGLIAIAFFGYKFYSSRSGKNYHTF